MLLSILKRKAKDIFSSEHTRLKGHNDTEPVDVQFTGDQLLQLALNEMSKSVFQVSNAVRCQKHYMRSGLVLSGSVRDWGKRLMELNKYILHFPIDDPYTNWTVPDGLPADELNDISDRAKPVHWHCIMLESNIEIQDMSWAAILEYYEKLESHDNIKNPNGQGDKFEGHTGKRKHKDNHKEKGSGKPAKNGQKPNFNRTEACKHCDKWHKVPDSECWTLNPNPSKKPKTSFKGGAKPKSEKSYMTQEEVSKMIAQLTTQMK